MSPGLKPLESQSCVNTQDMGYGPNSILSFKVFNRVATPRAPQHLSGTSHMHSSGGEAGVQGGVGVDILSSVWCLSGEDEVLSLGYGCVCILSPVNY